MSDLNTIDLFEHRAYRRLIDVALAMSAADSLENLLNQILQEAKHLTRSDGGTIYLTNKEGDLSFAILMNDSLDLHQSSLSSGEIDLPDVPRKKTNGELNLSNVAAAAANLGKTIVIDDVYENQSYDFQGTRLFDEMLDYRSRSFLTVALRDYHEDCIGVLQLLNARDTNGEVIPFDLKTISVVEALASLACVAIQNRLAVEQSESDLEGVKTELEEVEEELRGKTIEDPTTGLPNRKYFDDILSKEWKRASRQGYEISLCLFEIDKFDKLTLDHGLDFSKACSRALANETSEHFRRPSDFIACFSEGIIVVLLPYLSSAQSVAAADKLRNAIEETAFIADGERVRVSLSVGVATVGDTSDIDHTQFLQLAASALAKVKISGGNATGNND